MAKVDTPTPATAKNPAPPPTPKPEEATSDTVTEQAKRIQENKDACEAKEKEILAAMKDLIGESILYHGVIAEVETVMMIKNKEIFVTIKPQGKPHNDIPLLAFYSFKRIQ